MSGNNRYYWALEILNIQPHDLILEIGCGAGILVKLMAEKLSGGHITAIDQSAAQLAKAQKRNQAAVAAGIVSFIHQSFLDTQLEEHRFHKICAFNVNLFWTQNPARELERIKTYLIPDGLLYLFYQSPGGSEEKVLTRVRENTRNNGFGILDMLDGPLGCCVLTRPDTAI